MPLSTNWRDIGFAPALYVSAKDGNDADVGNKTSPKQTIPVTATTAQIRSGIYDVNYAFVPPAGTQTFVADGYVIADFNSIVNTYSFGTQYSEFIGFQLKNLIVLSATFPDSTGVQLNQCVVVSGCDFEITSQQPHNLTLFKAGTVRMNSSISLPTNISRSTINNIFLFNQNFNLIKSAITENCIATIPSAGTAGNSVISGCAISNNATFNGQSFGLYTLNGDGANIQTTYADGQKFNGTLTIGVVTISFTDCFWTANFGFNDSTIGDFTLRDNPRSVLWNDGNIIGAYDIGVRFLPSNAGFDPSNGATYVGVNRNTVNEKFELTASPSGVVTSSLNPLFALNFGELVTLENVLLWFGLVPPLEVVQLTKYDGVAPNPTVRLDYEINIYDESEPNGANNPANFIGWKRMEVNMPVELDAGNLGNGNQDALLDDIGAAIVNRFALRFTIREDGN